MQISDEMLNDAIRAYNDIDGGLSLYPDAVRAALEAALSAAEPAGQVDASYGEGGMLVASFNPNTLPIGTKLYAAPPAPSVVVKAWTTEDEAREYRSFSKWFKDRGYPGYPEQYSLVCENAMHAAWQEAAKRTALTAQVQDVAGAETLETYYERQIEWSRETFGPALRTKGIIDHIKKELREIEADPHDLSEWVDVVILAMDGFWRHGGNASDLFSALLAKQKKNMARTWPDWRTMSEDTAIEHDRSKDEVTP